MNSVIGYLRVSTTEQGDSGLGMDAQRAVITDEAARKRWQVTWVEDSGYSAKDFNRPGITHALHVLAAHDSDALVVSKLDRLSRSVVDFASTLGLASKQGWAVVALDLGVDTSTPTGELVAGVMMQVAQWERRIIGQRTQDALHAAKQRGQRLGRPRATPDAVVAQVVALAADGHSPHRIAQALNTAGTPTTRGAQQWRGSTVRRLLNGHALDQLSNELDLSQEGVG